MKNLICRWFGHRLDEFNMHSKFRYRVTPGIAYYYLSCGRCGKARASTVSISMPGEVLIAERRLRELDRRAARLMKSKTLKFLISGRKGRRNVTA